MLAEIRRDLPRLLTRDEALRIATNIAKLPELASHLLGDERGQRLQLAPTRTWDFGHEKPPEPQVMGI